MGNVGAAGIESIEKAVHFLVGEFQVGEQLNLLRHGGGS